MDASLDHLAKLRRAYQLWHETRGASVQHWLDLMADDVILRSAGDVASGIDFTEGRSGKAAVDSYFAGLAADWEMVHFTPEEFISQGDRVVVLSRVAFRSRRTGKVATSPKADVFRFRDGLVVELAEFFDTNAAAIANRPD